MLNNNSSVSSLASSTTTSSNNSQSSSVWKKITKLLHPNKKRRNSETSSSGNTVLSGDSIDSGRRQRKPLVQTIEQSPPMIIPPFSPTYCKANEFPYSNFYVKLPDGRWMIRYRDGNREILRTDIMEGYMI